VLGVINHAQQKAKGGMHKKAVALQIMPENNEILRNKCLR
jgi:hypothetical protein